MRKKTAVFKTWQIFLKIPFRTFSDTDKFCGLFNISIVWNFVTHEYSAENDMRVYATHFGEKFGEFVNSRSGCQFY